MFESLDWCFYVEGGTNICGDEVDGFVELDGTGVSVEIEVV